MMYIQNVTQQNNTWLYVVRQQKDTKNDIQNNDTMTLGRTPFGRMALGSKILNRMAYLQNSKQNRTQQNNTHLARTQ